MGPDGKLRFVPISGQTNFDPESDDTLNGRTVAKHFSRYQELLVPISFSFLGTSGLVTSLSLSDYELLNLVQEKKTPQETTVRICHRPKLLKMKKISTMTSRF